MSLIYNLLGATLAMTGVINPLIAAVMMPVSSLTVVLIAWLSRSFEPAERIPAESIVVSSGWAAVHVAAETGDAT